MAELAVQNMSLADLQATLGWAEDEGWNPGIADAEAFLAADPQGFFLTRRKGEPVAAVSVVNHNAKNAFLGLYICRPEWRGLGFGLSTWEHALKHAGERTVGLDGVPEQQDNYRKSGFVRTGQTLRHVGRFPPRESLHVRDADAGDLAHLVRLDAQANGFMRQRFLEAWLSPAPQLRASRVLVRDGSIQGFATWRACVEGTKIGPVIAASTRDALELIADIAAIRANGRLIIDVPEANAALRRELASAGFFVPFATARMYRGPAPEQGAYLKAIATMELG